MGLKILMKKYRLTRLFIFSMATQMERREPFNFPIRMFDFRWNGKYPW